jgi:hypothetical protein
VIKEVEGLLRKGSKSDKKMRETLSIGPYRMGNILKYMESEGTIRRKKVGRDTMSSLVAK